MRAALFAVPFLFAFASSAPAGNFTLTIDGQSFEIDEGSTITATTKSGHAVEISLTRKEFSTFADPPVSFEHPGTLSVAATDLGDGIHQYLLSTARGTMVLVQTYDSFNPSTLAETMLKELSKDKVATGVALAKESHARTLADGTTLTGLKGMLTSPADDVVIEVLAVDRGFGGVLAVTQRDRKLGADEQPLIDRFWSSFQVNAK